MRPLKVFENTSVNNISLKEMSDTEIYNGIIYQVLLEFASTGGTGNLVGSGTNGSVAIGTLNDTFRVYGPGAHGFTGVADTGVNSLGVSQVTSTDYSGYARPLCWKNGGLTEMSDSDINTYIIDPALQQVVNGGIGSYYLSTSYPSHIQNASWAQIFAFNDTIFTGYTGSTIYLWRLISLPATPSIRPLLWYGNNSLYELNDSALRSLVHRLRNRIVESGVGTYQISTSAPSNGGTWSQLGNAFVDTRSAMATNSYAGSYAGSYLGYYPHSYTGYYTGYYSGEYTGTYTTWYGGSGVNYSGTYTGAYAGTYAGTYTGWYAGWYSGSYTGYYAGNTVQNNAETVNTYALWVRKS